LAGVFSFASPKEVAKEKATRITRSAAPTALRYSKQAGWIMLGADYWFAAVDRKKSQKLHPARRVRTPFRAPCEVLSNAGLAGAVGWRCLSRRRVSPTARQAE